MPAIWRCIQNTFSKYGLYNIINGMIFTTGIIPVQIVVKPYWFDADSCLKDDKPGKNPPVSLLRVFHRAGRQFHGGKMRFLHRFIAGAFIGILNILSYVVKKPLGVSSSYVTADVMGLKAAGSQAVNENEFLKKHSKADYQLIMVIFMALGGFLSALLFGRSRGRPMRSLTDVSMQLVGGFLMLFGARIGKGCTSGNILSGGAQMSLGSLLFAAATFISGILTMKFLGGGR